MFNDCFCKIFRERVELVSLPLVCNMHVLRSRINNLEKPKKQYLTIFLSTQMIHTDVWTRLVLSDSKFVYHRMFF